MARLRLDHVALPAFDAAATLRFYTEALGLVLTDACSGDDQGEQPWLMLVFGSGDGRALALTVRRGVDAPANDVGDVRHVAFAVASVAEMETWRRCLQERGVRCRGEDHGTQQSIYFEDPSGNVFEITAPPSEQAMQPNASAQAVVQRWLDRGA